MRKLIAIASLTAVLASIGLLFPSPALAHAQVSWLGSYARGEINTTHTTAYACKLSISVNQARTQIRYGANQFKEVIDTTHNGSCVTGSIPSTYIEWRVCIVGGPTGNVCLAWRPL